MVSALSSSPPTRGSPLTATLGNLGNSVVPAHAGVAPGCSTR